MDLAKGDFADRGELCTKRAGSSRLCWTIRPAQRIEGAERMSRSLGFDLVLSRGDVGVGRGGLDDRVIVNTLDLITWGKISGYNPLKSSRNFIEKRLHPLRRRGIDRVANFLLTSSFNADQADLLPDDYGVPRPQRAVSRPIVDRSFLSRRSRWKRIHFSVPRNATGDLHCSGRPGHSWSDRDVVFDDLFYILQPVAQFPSERPQIRELRLILRGVLDRPPF